ncbi:MAG TPA: hypothetical protein PKA77_10375 [Chitinophagaceae bacterium]|jgi:hypothetical protein|nr:hypothetical protein [Chitinophagaceae bacterium]HMU56906.1 hypothetical protein [Chitinophagaceae bacterium]
MMKVFEANISHQTADFLNKKLSRVTLFETANEKLVVAFGINNFFERQAEYEVFKDAISTTQNIVSEPDRTEYGDFQTNQDLAKSVTKLLKTKKKINPKLVIEPTCGKGNFIVAALSAFSQIEEIIGVEIYKPYTWETKFNIIDFYISNPSEHKPRIEIFHFNVFDFDFNSLISKSKDKILILGNPPWVTNSKLSSLQSTNLPQKSNFKKHGGLDAITGKGNFDIGEYITLMMFDAFQNTKGHLVFLLKNSVIKNVVFDQYQRKYRISDIEKLTIDSKKEFNVSVEAALLFCKLNSQPEYTCKEYNFYQPTIQVKEFGWIADKFVSNTDLYRHSSDIDGVCPFEWRQGIKHDLSSIMELERVNGHFINGKYEEIRLEEDLIFGVLKSSDLKQTVINHLRKFTIITQKKVGQDTSFIKQKYPKTFSYLQSHKEQFNQRKSSIYNNKPDFSIFGVGDYSFSPYKVAISGLYKTFTFSLVLPLNSKPVMLDDTCYLLGFDKLEFATYTTILLNSNETKELLQAITFSDAKRTFTKDILMRIDLYKLATKFSDLALLAELNSLNSDYNLQVSPDRWNDFLLTLKPKQVTKQMDIFAPT